MWGEGLLLDDHLHWLVRGILVASELVDDVVESLVHVRVGIVGDAFQLSETINVVYLEHLQINGGDGTSCNKDSFAPLAT
jgi:hypothetical protein